MRLLTFRTDRAPRPGLLADDGRIVDPTAALSAARDPGMLTFEGPVPGDLLGPIRAGDAFLHAAEGIAALVRDGPGMRTRAAAGPPPDRGAGVATGRRTSNDQPSPKRDT